MEQVINIVDIDKCTEEAIKVLSIPKRVSKKKAIVATVSAVALSTSIATGVSATGIDSSIEEPVISESVEIQSTKDMPTVTKDTSEFVEVYKMMYTTDYVNARMSPSLTSEIARVYEPNTPVKILSYDSEWSLVGIGNYQYFMCTHYLSDRKIESGVHDTETTYMDIIESADVDVDDDVDFSVDVNDSADTEMVQSSDIDVDDDVDVNDSADTEMVQSPDYLNDRVEFEETIDEVDNYTSLDNSYNGVETVDGTDSSTTFIDNTDIEDDNYEVFIDDSNNVYEAGDDNDFDAIITSEDLMNRGIVSYGDYRYTWYSEKVLPGEGLVIPGRHVDENGYVCDENGYICVASDSLARGTVVCTPLGKDAKVYDCGTGVDDVLDVYVSW